MKYYYFINSFNNRKGPFRIDELHNYNILRTTLVWCEGMPNWQPAGQVPELAFYSNRRIMDKAIRSLTRRLLNLCPISPTVIWYGRFSTWFSVTCSWELLHLCSVLWWNTIGTVRNMNRLHRHPRMPVSLILSVWYWVFSVWWHGLWFGLFTGSLFSDC